MNKLLAFSFACLVLAVVIGCTEVKEPVRNESTDNPTIPVALLFEHEGCRVYRFIDADRYRYYADCRLSSNVTSEWEESCGKSCIQNVQSNTTTGYSR